jgi:secondary thiamine-phosphate synthase enzyme
MRLETTVLERSTSGDTDVLDLTGDVQDFLTSAGVEEGWVLIAVPGSTASVTTIEFESGAVSDLKKAVERLAPREAEYDHNLRWGDGNGYSHVRAALLGPSLVLPVSHGQLVTGTWQQVVLCDFDNRPRTRRIHLQVMGA